VAKVAFVSKMFCSSQGVRFRFEMKSRITGRTLEVPTQNF